MKGVKINKIKKPFINLIYSLVLYDYQLFLEFSF